MSGVEGSYGRFVAGCARVAVAALAVVAVAGCVGLDDEDDAPATTHTGTATADISVASGAAQTSVKQDLWLDDTDCDRLELKGITVQSKTPGQDLSFVRGIEIQAKETIEYSYKTIARYNGTIKKGTSSVPLQLSVRELDDYTADLSDSIALKVKVDGAPSRKTDLAVAFSLRYVYGP